MNRPSQEQIEFATRAWMAAFRRLWAREYPERPCPLLDYEALNGAGASIMHGAIRSALSAADPKTIERLKKQRETLS